MFPSHSKILPLTKGAGRDFDTHTGTQLLVDHKEFLVHKTIKCYTQFMISLKTIQALLGKLDFSQDFNTEQTAICVLAMMDVKHRKDLLNHCKCLRDGARIHDIIAFAWSDRKRRYAENTRESFRKGSLQRLVNHGLAIVNPDDPERPTNSGSTNYILTPEFINILEHLGSPALPSIINEWRERHKNVLSKRKKIDTSNQIEIMLPNSKRISLSPGIHNALEKEIIESFVSFHIQEPVFLYVGDAQNKMLYLDEKLLAALGIELNVHTRLPDIIVYSTKLDTIFAIESVTSVGPVEEKRKTEIEEIFKHTGRPVECVTAFLDRRMFGRFSRTLAWGTFAWIAEEPEHLIRFNGPYR